MFRKIRYSGQVPGMHLEWIRRVLITGHARPTVLYINKDMPWHVPISQNKSSKMETPSEDRKIEIGPEILEQSQFHQEMDHIPCNSRIYFSGIADSCRSGHQSVPYNIQDNPGESGSSRIADDPHFCYWPVQSISFPFCFCSVFQEIQEMPFRTLTARSLKRVSETSGSISHISGLW